jgi:hypothetical protein
MTRDADTTVMRDKGIARLLVGAKAHVPVNDTNVKKLLHIEILVFMV